MPPHRRGVQHKPSYAPHFGVPKCTHPSSFPHWPEPLTTPGLSFPMSKLGIVCSAGLEVSGSPREVPRPEWGLPLGFSGTSCLPPVTGVCSICSQKTQGFLVTWLQVSCLLPRHLWLEFFLSTGSLSQAPGELPSAHSGAHPGIFVLSILLSPRFLSSLSGTRVVIVGW